MASLSSLLSLASDELAHREFVAKSIIYRIISAALTVLVAFVFTNDALSAINIGIAANLLKTVLYYLFEHAWARFW